MKRTIDGKGWFTFTVSGLASGDTAIVTRHNSADIKDIARVCETLQYSGFARCSRKGWWTLEHADLGTVQWKSGYDFRTAGEFFFLRLNGKLIVRAWPTAGSRRYTRAQWVADSAKELPENIRERVERFLGTLQDGSQIAPEDRDAA